MRETDFGDSKSELRPDPRVVDALRGEISGPIQTISHRPGSKGKSVEVRLVTDGPGMFGLSDWQDNREWSGITNHVFLSARYATHFAEQMRQAGYETNPGRILNGMIVSHAGRRQWDEAEWYPEAVLDAVAKRSISNETLGMRLIVGKVPIDAFELVVALGHNVEGFSVDPTIYDSLDFKLAIYVDHRTAQKYEPLNTRMADFLLGNFFRGNEVTPELREQVYRVVETIIERQRNQSLGKEVILRLSLDEADEMAGRLGASPNSERLTRRELMRLVLQDADTEALLIKAGIDPDDINDETVPMPEWEHDLRWQYVEAAKESIIERISSLNEALQSEGLYSDDRVVLGTLERFGVDFPVNTWWGQYVRILVDPSKK